MTENVVFVLPKNHMTSFQHYYTTQE